MMVFWSIWVNRSVIELLSLLNPGPEIVLYRFDIISPRTLAGHPAFQFHLLLSPDEGESSSYSHQSHAGCRKPMYLCKANLIGNNWGLDFVRITGVIGDIKFSLVLSISSCRQVSDRNLQAPWIPEFHLRSAASSACLLNTERLDWAVHCRAIHICILSAGLQ